MNKKIIILMVYVSFGTLALLAQPSNMPIWKLTETISYSQDLVSRASRGDANAQVLLGSCYSNGKGIAKDLQEAIGWLQKAANQGNADGYYYLSKCYSAGSSEQKVWFQKALDMKHPVALCDQASTYDYAVRTIDQPHPDPDGTKATKFYRESAERGYTWAQIRLAGRCLDGKGIAKDSTEAVKWYRKAAEQGWAKVETPMPFCFHITYYYACRYHGSCVA